MKKPLLAHVWLRTNECQQEERADHLVIIYSKDSVLDFFAEHRELTLKVDYPKIRRLSIMSTTDPRLRTLKNLPPDVRALLAEDNGGSWIDEYDESDKQEIQDDPT